MGRSIAELKRAACEAIDNHREDIMALGDSIFNEPELGYKEFKTAAKVYRATSSSTAANSFVGCKVVTALMLTPNAC